MPVALLKTTAIGGVLAVAVLGLAACGGSSTPTAAGTSTSASLKPATTSAATPKPGATSRPTGKLTAPIPTGTVTPQPYLTPPLKLVTKPGPNEPGFRQIGLSISNDLRTVTPDLVAGYPQGIPISTGIPVKILATTDFDGYIRIPGLGIKAPITATGGPSDIEFYAKKNGLFKAYLGRDGSPYPEKLIFGLHVCPTCRP